MLGAGMQYIECSKVCNLVMLFEYKIVEHLRRVLQKQEARDWGLVDSVCIATLLEVVSQGLGQDRAGARSPAQQGSVRTTGQGSTRAGISVKRATWMIAGGGV